MNIPNKLTVLRILLVPVFLVFAAIAKTPGYSGWWYAAIACYVASGITDILDGPLARANNQVTNFGKFIDPIADKLVVVAALLIANDLGFLSYWITIIVLLREFIVDGIRLIAVTQGGKMISASALGKIKTASQFVGLTGIFIAAAGVTKIWVLTDYFPWLTPLNIGQWVIYASTVIAVWGGMEYVIRNWHIIKSCACEEKTE
jgi:CDP-diacylglycerol---glycerol-3-phosphate 3-phosphatidyltransferase